MRRSELNQIMTTAISFIREMRFHLPPFAYWLPQEWLAKDHEYDEIRTNRLGWDITDFGSGDFHRIGLLMFTLRNGNYHLPGNAKTYAEKLLLVEENQVTPYHFHWSKVEDIINRGGGNLLVTLYNSTADERLADTPLQVSVDGRHFTASAGSTIRLTPGESITLPTRCYHQFCGEPGTGLVLLGEVSTINDDAVDNRFFNPVGRFPVIEEDTMPLHLLCNEYPVAT